MNWQQLIRMFTQNEKLIEKLSESKPMKHAARLTVYWFLRARQNGLDKFTKPDPNATAGNSTSVKSFFERFKTELDKGLKDLKNDKNKKP